MKASAVESAALPALRKAADLVGAGLVDRWSADLATALYAGWYAGWLGADGLPWREASEPFVAATAELDLVPGSSRDLTGALRWSHAGSHDFQPGWRARQVSTSGRVIASRNGAVRVLDTADYVATIRAGLPPPVGGDLAAVRRLDSVDSSPGFWLTVGDAWPSTGVVPGLVRIYWNVRGEDAPALVAALTDAFLGGPSMWALKLPVDLAQHVRRDAAVVYLLGSDFTAHSAGLAVAAATLAGHLVPEEPPLTLRLAPGVGLAEDPPGDDSFGTSRCRLVAAGLASASSDDPDALVAAVLDHLRTAGIDPERPHLEPGSRRSYALPAPVAVPRVVARPFPGPSRSWSALPVADRERFLDGAGAIARQLVTEALWHEDRCTWVGDTVVHEGGAWTVAAQTCESDLYGGTAGIGRFLAQWAAATGDAAAERTAAGALRHAVGMAPSDGPASGGIFLGPIGTAWAAIETADLLHDPVLNAAGRRLAHDTLAAITTERADQDDLLGGEAGTIVGLLAVADACGETEPWLSAARAAGARLLATAHRSGLGWHWPGARGASGYGLCGLAHGTSGIALALLRLSARSSPSDVTYLEAVRGALAYERRWYRGEAVGWPDLRELTGADLALGRGLVYPALWCHGAVGAGLVRLHAFMQDGEAAHLAEAGAALQASRAAAAHTLRLLAEAGDEAGPAANWSLCHGLMGAAELMLCAAANLGEPAHLEAARRLGERALADRTVYGAWRCGVAGGGETPGLLLGLAGIGTTLLRLHDATLAASPALPGLHPWPERKVSPGGR